MDRRDLELALDWAAREGWNPGLDDAAAFLAADPAGFLVGLVGGDVVAAIACPRYDARFGFVGLYLVRDDMRGRGLGLKLWHAGHEHLDGATVGLDAVDAQVSNYERSGYRAEGLTYRYRGVGGGVERDADLLPVDELPAGRLAEFDALAFPARREAFLGHWTSAPGSVALALSEGDAVLAYGVRRRCRAGHKIGPLFARDRDAAERVLDGLVSGLAAGDEWWIDVPHGNRDAVGLAEALRLEPGFRTSRMYRGEPPSHDRSMVFGVTTLELG